MNSELWEIHVQIYKVFNYSHDITLRKPNNTVNLISSLIIDSKIAQTISSDGINRIYIFLFKTCQENMLPQFKFNELFSNCPDELNACQVCHELATELWHSQLK